MGYSTLRRYAVTLDDSTAGSRKLTFLPFKAGLNTFATSSDWTPAAADFKICKAVTGSGLGAEASIGTAPTWVNGRVVLILSGTELTCRYLTIRIENAAINSDEIIVETYGNASAQYPQIYDGGGVGNLLTDGTGTSQISVSGGRGDWSTATALTAVSTQVTNLNNLSALMNIYGPTVGEIPDAGSRDYLYTVVNRDVEGHLLDLDASALPTVAVHNDFGADRSANLSLTVTRVSVGRYTFRYTVASDHNEETLTFDITGTAASAARYATMTTSVVNYDYLTTVNAINTKLGTPAGASISADIAGIAAKTGNLPADPADASDIAAAIGTVNTTLGTISGYVDTEIAAIKLVTDQLGTALETIGGGVYRYTAAALAQAPASASTTVNEDVTIQSE